MAKTTFVPFIDPFIWIYLLLSGKFFGRVICFRHFLVPKWRIERVRTSNLSMQVYSELHIKAKDFALSCTKPDPNASINYQGTFIDLSIYQHRKLMQYICDVFVAAHAISSLKTQGNAYLETPLLFGKNLTALEEWLQENTSLTPRRSFFLRSIYPIINHLALIGFSLAIYCHALIKRKTPRAETFDYIFNQVTPSEQSLNYAEDLSAAILSADTPSGSVKINYIIKPDSIRDKWEDNGYSTIKNLFNIPVRIKIKHLFSAANLIFSRHVNCSFPSSYLSLMKIAYADAAIKSSFAHGYIGTISNVEDIPIEALVFKSHKKPTVMICYSSTVFHNINFSYLQFDHLFVWNDIQKDFIKQYPQQDGINYHVIGPIMFSDDKLPAASPHQKPRGDFKIGVYDITAKPDELIDAKRLTTNYTLEYYNKFFADILSLQSLDDRVVLKNKQKRDEVFNPKFETNGIVSERPLINPYKSIDDCDLVICMPFTSMYFAAKNRGIKAIFYSADDHYYYNGIKELDKLLVTGRKELTMQVQQAIFARDKTQVKEGPQHSDLGKQTNITPMLNTRLKLLKIIDQSNHKAS